MPSKKNLIEVECPLLNKYGTEKLIKESGAKLEKGLGLKVQIFLGKHPPLITREKSSGTQIICPHYGVGKTSIDCDITSNYCIYSDLNKD
ncbi:hypothetical protein B6U91_00340 [Candidatus Pacearchaeota archaeon ex4484_71]|nr:MAG: hypothetical protein B6U91_00340 [Candidatus Pacearchaeota archaeon ex4484_71]